MEKRQKKYEKHLHFRGRNSILKKDLISVKKAPTVGFGQKAEKENRSITGKDNYKKQN